MSSGGCLYFTATGLSLERIYPLHCTSCFELKKKKLKLNIS